MIKNDTIQIIYIWVLTVLVYFGAFGLQESWVMSTIGTAVGLTTLYLTIRLGQKLDPNFKKECSN